MAVYYINSYDIESIEEFKKYAPAVYPLLQKYGAKVLAADTEVIVMEGTARTMNAIIRFPSKEAALNCYNDPEYQEIKKIRINSTKNCTMVLAQQISQ